MKTYYVYILECSDSSYYIGVTNNLERRISEHNLGEGGQYTKRRRPVSLVYSSDFLDPLSAIEAEKQLKGWTKAKKKALIQNDIELLKALSRCHPSSGSG